MKFKILFLLLFISITGFSQTDKNVFFGINLNLDWYSLTNQSAVVYQLEDQAKESKYVIMDCDFIKDKIDNRFLSLGFQELLLIFQKEFKGNLNNLKPDVFLARTTYSNINEYAVKSKNDIEKSKALFNEEFGLPELNMIKNEYSVYKWKGAYHELILTCRVDELTTTLIYTKQ